MAGALINLIGEQAIPSLLPVLWLEPGELHLVFSDRTRPRADWLAWALAGVPETAHMRIERHHLASAYDLVAVQRYLDTLVDRVRVSDLTLNLTGGTKIMSLAAYRVGEERQLPMVYLVTEEGRTLLRFRGSQAPRREDVRVNVSIQSYLMAYGFHATTACGVPEAAWCDAAGLLADAAAKIPAESRDGAPPEQRLFKLLRGAMSDVKLKNAPTRLADPHPAEQALLEKLAERGLIAIVQPVSSADRSITVAPLRGARQQFLGGKWLEVFCYLQARDAPQFDDRALGVKLWRVDEAGPRAKVDEYGRRHDNEIDLVVSQNGRVAFVSCKSGHPKQQDIDQLNSITNQLRAGTYCVKVLVTAAPSLLEDRAGQARANGITVICANELATVADRLAELTA